MFGWMPTCTAPMRLQSLAATPGFGLASFLTSPKHAPGLERRRPCRVSSRTGPRRAAGWGGRGARRARQRRGQRSLQRSLRNSGNFDMRRTRGVRSSQVKSDAEQVKTTKSTMQEVSVAQAGGRTMPSATQAYRYRQFSMVPCMHRSRTSWPAQHLVVVHVVGTCHGSCG